MTTKMETPNSEGIHKLTEQAMTQMTAVFEKPDGERSRTERYAVNSYLEATLPFKNVPDELKQPIQEAAAFAAWQRAAEFSERESIIENSPGMALYHALQGRHPAEAEALRDKAREWEAELREAEIDAKKRGVDFDPIEYINKHGNRFTRNGNMDLGFTIGETKNVEAALTGKNDLMLRKGPTYYAPRREVHKDGLGSGEYDTQFEISNEGGKEMARAVFGPKDVLNIVEGMKAETL